MNPQGQPIFSGTPPTSGAPSATPNPAAAPPQPTPQPMPSQPTPQPAPQQPIMSAPVIPTSPYYPYPQKKSKKPLFIIGGIITFIIIAIIVALVILAPTLSSNAAAQSLSDLSSVIATSPSGRSDTENPYALTLLDGVYALSTSTIAERHAYASTLREKQSAFKQSTTRLRLDEETATLADNYNNAITILITYIDLHSVAKTLNTADWSDEQKQQFINENTPLLSTASAAELSRRIRLYLDSNQELYDAYAKAKCINGQNLDYDCALSAYSGKTAFTDLVAEDEEAYYNITAKGIVKYFTEELQNQEKNLVIKLGEANV